MELEELVARREENTFKTELIHRKLNIFKVNFHPQSKEFQSCPELLRENLFSLDAMVKTSKNTSINIFRDMSSYSRQIVMGRPEKVPRDYRLTSSDLAINMEELVFRDMLMVADGKVSPRLATQLMGEDDRIEQH